MKGRLKPVLEGRAVMFPSLFICLMTGWNTIDELWYAARHTDLFSWSIEVLRKSELIPGRDLFRLIHMSIASLQAKLPW